MTPENNNNFGQLDPDLSAKLAHLETAHPFIPYVAASRLFSTVGRMKAEVALEIPIHHRTGCAISTETGLAANQMDEAGWNQFYEQLTTDLHKKYPDLYARLFEESDTV